MSATQRWSFSADWVPEATQPESHMAEREQVQKPAPAERETQEAQAPATSERGEEIKAELDDLLDEIDEVLESNAEDFVKSYIQKGGQ